MIRTLYTGDNLKIMQGLDDNLADLIYLDPPFNSNRDYGEFDDKWKDYHESQEYNLIKSYIVKEAIDLARVSHSKEMFSYLVFMSVRLQECKRILANHGSIYLHVDPTASHYLKVIMDCIFGKDNFRNEIVWSYRRWGKANNDFKRMHDVILRYSKSKDVIWNQQYEPLAESTLKVFGDKEQSSDYSSGKRRAVTLNKKSKGATMRDVWEIGIIAPRSKERLGYPTQKPLALLKRIILASSDIDDVILDPFYGSGTSLIAAEKYGRNWIGIDKNDNSNYLEKLAVQTFGELTFDYNHRKVESND